jgi:hypothetical protein
MRVGPDEFQNKIKQALSDKPAPSVMFEARLFAQAEDLLAIRRERLELRKSDAVRLAQKRAHLLSSFQESFSRILDIVAIRPDVPAAATALAALVLVFLALHNGHGHGVSLTYADLPDFPKNNDAPARYDAQRLVEQNAYEREVEDAHRRTSGGL